MKGRYVMDRIAGFLLAGLVIGANIIIALYFLTWFVGA